MAVKKAKKEENVVVDTVLEEKIEVENNPVESNEAVDDSPQADIDEAEIETPLDKAPVVEIDKSAVTVNKNKLPKSDVKIRMRVNHKCTIAMVRYDLVAGKVYNVPENVKRILDKAGLLAPL